MRSLHMNAIRAIPMSFRRRSFRGTDVAGALLVGLVALAAFVLPGAPSSEPASAGASVHAKNSATPGWILKLQTRNARQSPVTAGNEEPGFWI